MQCSCIGERTLALGEPLCRAATWVAWDVPFLFKVASFMSTLSVGKMNETSFDQVGSHGNTIVIHLNFLAY